VIVLDSKGRFFAALGSPGGNSIVAYVAKTLVGLLDWKLSMQEAAALPNLVARGPSVSLETGFSPEIAAYLKAKGLPVAADRGEDSGVHGIVRRGSHLEGGADPRRDGVAKGY
jgi:gamma-glutamyltranspeptidase/glutathione hydrolase